MKEESRQSLFASSLLRVYTVACHRAGHGLSCEECKAEHQISIPLSGVNVKQVEGEVLTVSPAQVSLSNRGEVYRIGHPFGSGEVMLNVILREDALAEAVRAHDPAVEERPERPFSRRQVPADSRLPRHAGACTASRACGSRILIAASGAAA